jgi:hypothetical protein
MKLAHVALRAGIALIAAGCGRHAAPVEDW